jgi:pyruvate,orthophosphate dikinase
MKNIVWFEEGNKDQKELLGGKGANLAEMVSIGLPVPKGFIITTEVCRQFLEGQQLTQMLREEIIQAVTRLEERTQKSFGGEGQPLLVSVRSGAKNSMPGMMDTILNLGLTDQSVQQLASSTGNQAFAYDCYRRLIQMYGDVVKGIDKRHFEMYLTTYKEEQGYHSDQGMTAKDWQAICQVFQSIYMEHTQEQFPQDPGEQLVSAVQAVFRSWNNPRAITYRNVHQLSHDSGTAVTVQEMVFGNSGTASGTGVAFTRNPTTGQKGLFGEFLLCAQGEDVVAGIRTPRPISDLAKSNPPIYEQFSAIAELLENHYLDMQDIEFTVEAGQLFILQTRNGKRTAKAAVQIAIDLVSEGKITKKVALQRLTPEMLDQLLHPIFSPEALAKANPFCKGLPASPGAAVGRVYFSAEAAILAHQAGEKVILLREETSPEDIDGMIISEAIVTSRGGMTSHAAVVARGLGVCCVAGCEQLAVDSFLKQAQCGQVVINEGDYLSVDGSTGNLYHDELSLVASRDFALLQTIIGWSKENADLIVRANAETLPEIQTAMSFGAAGIGLARTEHMFFGESRIWPMRQVILAETNEERKVALAQLKVFQLQDFKKLLGQTKEQPCVVRLLDPPLHEFLPKFHEYDEMVKRSGYSLEKIKQRIHDLQEINPMMGHRGSRLGITYPEIYEMQTGAIIEAALQVSTRGHKVSPEIMLPLISLPEEMLLLRERLENYIQEIFVRYQKKVPYKIGMMLETPRACLMTKELAPLADFFSFGTNDLTQMTFGFSRDDAAGFIQDYLDQGILREDPYQHLDKDGVGQLMSLGVASIRQQGAKSIGVCGEVGGDPQSIAFFREIGIDYVSCSPYRVPAAWLTIAQSTPNKFG